MRNSLIPHALLVVLLLTSMVMKPCRYRWLMWLLIVGLAPFIFFSQPSSDPSTNAIVRHLFTNYIFVAFDFIVLTDVQNELRQSGQGKPISNAPFWARLRWAFQLFFSARGVGWSHEPKGVLPPHPRITRRHFLASQGFWLVFYVLLIDAVHCIGAHTSVFTERSIPTSSQPWHWRFWALLLFGIRSVACINVPHIVLSIVSVGGCMTEPKGWPPLFGNFNDAYTVRQFWGRTWHQSLRRVVSSPGKHLARRLRFSPGSQKSCYTQLFVAFIMHGVLHMQPTDFRPLYFFLAQPVAMSLEAVVIAVAARIGYHSPTSVYRIFGHIWVCCWFAFCVSDYMDSLISWGMLDAPFNIGLTSEILRHSGVVKNNNILSS
ncbi:membrane bound O-acyl transferase family-domain-containing protein [Collybia nuda]|uniref:Membrane bound O-acyl transferase family-domain-containing protein n=1 Tax=Collybia nuda TaxID=64659 RepID=A0A9P5Y006_9AGAR|nr:membrane bound O-acyl transferase family-domain-containing protein [Collybia nuda]